VPTIAESGLAGFEAAGWMGLLAPAGTPKAVIDKLNRQIVDSVKAESMSKMLVSQGFDVMTGSPDDFAAFIARDIPRWAEAVKISGATVN
jgi:tripartite-type tricarboxylate transporter receptor subunit TctC